MREILVIRFSSLGDLCVLGSVLARRAALDPSVPTRVTLVTKAAFAPLMTGFDGIDRVIPLADGSLGGLFRLARHLGRTRWDTIIDAHGVLRSNMLLTFMGRRPHARLAKDTLSRLALLGWGRQAPELDRSMADRFAQLFTTPGGALPPAAGPALPTGQQTDPGSRPRMGLAPGAQWPSKRWPPEHFAELLAGLMAENRWDVDIFLGPRESDWFSRSPLAEVAAGFDNVRLIADRDLLEVADHLAACRVLVTNDSGLMHLAEAVDTPVLAFFGPTVEAFGYFPRLPASRVLERSLDCRPCSRNGKRPCHQGDLPCLREIQPAEALAAILAMPPVKDANA